MLARHVVLGAAARGTAVAVAALRFTFVPLGPLVRGVAASSPARYGARRLAYTGAEGSAG